MIKSAPRHRPEQPGQALVEFAIASMLYFTIIFGVIEMGWLLFTHHQVTAAAREGARWAAVNGTQSRGLRDPQEIASYRLDPDEVKQAALDRVLIQRPDDLTVTVDDGTLRPKDNVTVNVRYRYRPLVGFILPSPSLNLRASSTMIVHY